MALRFIDSCTHYGTADLPAKYEATGGTMLVVSNTGRRSGVGTLRATTGANDNVVKVLTAQSAWVLGAAVYISGAHGTSDRAVLFALLDGATLHMTLVATSTGNLCLMRAGTTAVGASSVSALNLDRWYYIEWRCEISNSIATSGCQVKVDGVLVLDAAGGADTQNAGNPQADRVRVGNTANPGTGHARHWGDLYLCDTTGPECSSFLGDVRVDALFPTLSGTVSHFSPSSAGATGVSMVNSAAPDTATYLYASTVSSLQRFFMSGLASAGGSIYGVQLCLAAQKSDAGARTAAPLIYASATSGEGASAALGVSYAYLLYATSATPTGASWTAVGVSSSEFGLKVTA